MESDWQPLSVKAACFVKRRKLPSFPASERLLAPSRCFYSSPQLSQLKGNFPKVMTVSAEIDVSCHPRLRNIKI